MENYRTVTEIRIKEFEYEWKIDQHPGNKSIYVRPLESGIWTSPAFQFELADDCTKWRIRLQIIENGKRSCIRDSTRNSMSSIKSYYAKPGIKLVDTRHPKITVDVEFDLFDSQSKKLTESFRLKDQSAFKGTLLETESIQLRNESDCIFTSRDKFDMILICNLKAAVKKSEPPKSSIIYDLAKLRVNGDFSDIIISVREREFHAHKNILAARSEVFSSMFKNEMKEAISGKLEIEDMEPESFEEFLKFIYTGDFHHQERACELFAAADKYDVQDLKAHCEDLIIKKMNIANCFKILALSERHTAKKLKNETIKFIASKVPLAKIHELAEFHQNSSLLIEIIEEFTKQRRTSV